MFIVGNMGKINEIARSEGYSLSMKKHQFIIITIFCFCVSLTYGATRAYAQDALLRELAYRIQSGSAADVKLYLASFHNLNVTDESGWPLLTIAAARTDAQALSIVQSLVEAGADPNYGGEHKNYPLISAVSSENTAVVGYLLEHNADYQAKSSGGVTAAQLIQQSNMPVMTAMLQKRIQQDQEKTNDTYSQGNLNRLTYELAFNSCAMQYYSYYYNSKQDAVAQEVQDKTIAHYKQAVSVAMTELARYFRVNADRSTMVFKNARTDIYTELENMVSNRYRREQEVGKLSDMEARCSKVAAPFGENYIRKEELPGTH